jgi:hypothetical protein
MADAVEAVQSDLVVFSKYVRKQKTTQRKHHLPTV